jgi:ABC-type uncharacterized transport system substrate-binding protein
MPAAPAPPETTSDNTTRPAAAETTSDKTTRPGDIQPAPTREVGILFNNTGGYAEVAQQLRKLLPSTSYRVLLADVDAATSIAALDALRRKPEVTIVAIGLPAARIARDRFKVPVVFAQVFNYQELLVNGRSVRGVAAMPPLDVQLQAWKKLDPKLRRLGLIVSEPHAGVIPAAAEAAKAADVTIKHEISDSDRATLYLFKRLAPQIDGLWLLPDDRILSPAVLRELLSYAVSHNVRVCVFSDTLLQWGAFMSATPTPTDIARKLRVILDGMSSTTSQASSTLVPVSEISIRVNTQVATRLGLTPPPTPSWTVRR